MEVIQFFNNNIRDGVGGEGGGPEPLVIQEQVDQVVEVENKDVVVG